MARISGLLLQRKALPQAHRGATEAGARQEPVSLKVVFLCQQEESLDCCGFCILRDAHHFKLVTYVSGHTVLLLDCKDECEVAPLKVFL